MLFKKKILLFGENKCIKSITNLLQSYYFVIISQLQKSIVLHSLKENCPQTQTPTTTTTPTTNDDHKGHRLRMGGRYVPGYHVADACDKGSFWHSQMSQKDGCGRKQRRIITLPWTVYPTNWRNQTSSTNSQWHFIFWVILRIMTWVTWENSRFKIWMETG